MCLFQPYTDKSDLYHLKWQLASGDTLSGNDCLMKFLATPFVTSAFLKCYKIAIDYEPCHTCGY